MSRGSAQPPPSPDPSTSPWATFHPGPTPNLTPTPPIIVLCHHGARSLSVTMWLRNQGLRSRPVLSPAVSSNGPARSTLLFPVTNPTRMNPSQLSRDLRRRIRRSLHRAAPTSPMINAANSTAPVFPFYDAVPPLVPIRADDDRLSQDHRLHSPIPRRRATHRSRTHWRPARRPQLWARRVGLVPLLGFRRGSPRSGARRPRSLPDRYRCHRLAVPWALPLPYWPNAAALAA